MRLKDADIVKLLPAWMQEDRSVQAIASGCNAVTKAIDARLRLLSRWNQIDQLSESELDAMAWDLNILWYDSTAPIETKRAVIRNSDRVYAKLGTKYAVEQITTDYFGTGEVREWYEYGGKPYHFKVLSDNPKLVNQNLDFFLSMLGIVKRRSAWLDAILICLTGDMPLYAGMAVREHAKELHAFGSEEIRLYYASAIHDANHETVSMGLTVAKFQSEEIRLYHASAVHDTSRETVSIGVGTAEL